MTSAPETIAHYRVHDELGRGGQGAVFAAEDTRLGRRVALKVLSAPFLSTTERRRLQREAEVASRLMHPGICAIYEVGQDRGLPFLAMQYVEGETLARKIALAQQDRTRTCAEVGPDTNESARGSMLALVDYFAGVARILQSAHEADLVHRDIKPANLMVTPEGRPVVLDFGIARDARDAGLTRTGDLVGTPAYMAPEQLEPADVDVRADIYALGVSMFEAMALARPFVAPTAELLFNAILREEPPDLRRLNPHITPDLAAVVAKALEKSPVRRYASALELAEDLEAVSEGRPVRAKPVSAPTRIARWARRRPAAAALLCVLAIGVPTACALAGYLYTTRATVRAARAARALERAELQVERAFLELGEGAPTRAAAAFEEILAAVAEPSLEPVAGLALAHLKLSQFERGLNCLDRYPRLARRHPSLRALRAALVARTGARSARIEVALDTASVDDLFVAAIVEIEAGHRKREGAFATAIELLEEAIARSPRARPVYYYELLHAAEHAGDRVRVERTAHLMTSRWPDRAASWFWCGYAFRRLDPARAATALDASLRLGVGSARTMARLHYASCLAATGRSEEALEIATEETRSGRASINGYVTQVSILERLGRNQEAIAILEEACRKIPRNTTLLMGLGMLYHKSARFLGVEALDKAQAAFESVIEIAPGHHAAYASLAAIARAKGQKAEALRLFEKSVAIQPAYWGGRYAIARLLLDMRLFEQAAVAFEATIALRPTDPKSYCLCAKARSAQRRYSATVHLMQKGHGLAERVDGWSWPSARWLSGSRKRLAELTADLASVSDGSSLPEGADRIALGHLAAHRNRTALAARAFAAGFEANEDTRRDLETGALLAAAGAAVRAGAGDGTDSVHLTPNERTRWRTQALAWFEECLDSWVRSAREGRVSQRRLAAMFAGWRTEPRWSPVRTPAALDALPAQEAERWRAAWRSIDSHVDRVNNGR